MCVAAAAAPVRSINRYLIKKKEEEEDNFAKAMRYVLPTCVQSFEYGFLNGNGSFGIIHKIENAQSSLHIYEFIVVLQCHTHNTTRHNTTDIEHSSS